MCAPVFSVTLPRHFFCARRRGFPPSIALRRSGKGGKLPLRPRAACAALRRIWRRIRCLAPHLTPYALPCAASCVDVCARHGPRSVGGPPMRAALSARPRVRTAGTCSPRAACTAGACRIGRRRAAQRVGLRVKFSLLYSRGPFRAPVSLTASCVGACPAGDRSFPRAFARGAARMRADTKRVSVLLYRKGRGFCRAPFRRLAVFIFPPLVAVFSALRAGQYLGQYLVWSFLRICTRRIFPLIVLGSSLTNSTTRGYL